MQQICLLCCRIFFFFPEGWILAGGFGEKEERMNVCLRGNINQEVPFCAKPVYEPPSRSDEKLRGFSAVYGLHTL